MSDKYFYMQKKEVHALKWTGQKSFRTLIIRENNTFLGPETLCSKCSLPLNVHGLIGFDEILICPDTFIVLEKDRIKNYSQKEFQHKFHKIKK